jgi:hypothetical protein
MTAFEEIVQRQIEAKMIRDEAIVRGLLGRWVSELEPSIAYRDGEVIGLCPAESDLGSQPFILEV